MKLISILAITAILLCLGGCGKESKPQVTLNLYTWADYFDPEMIKAFEKEYNCRIVIDYFDSNESMYAKLKAGSTGYDLITPSSYMAALLQQQGFLQPLDALKIPNRTNVDSEYLKIAIDKEMKYSVPYMTTYTGVAFLKDKVKDFKPSWAMFARADLANRMTMLNDMRETLGAALRYKGYSLNSTNEQELAEARDQVIEWKKNLAKFENEQYKPGIASAEYFMVHGYSGDILQVQAENPNIVFMLPEEGFSVSVDDLVIPKTAKNAEIAYAFINYLHRPEVAAANTSFTSYLCPNQASFKLLDQAVLDNPGIFPSAEVRAKGEIIMDLGADNEKMIKAWDEVKAASN